MRTKLLILAIFGFCTMAQSQVTKRLTMFDESFAHCVYFWLKNPDSETDRTKFETELRTFLNNSSYAKTNFIGIPPKATRDVVDDSFTYALILSFVSAEAQENYQNEPAHLKFIEECKDLWEKVIVYDAEGLRQ